MDLKILRQKFLVERSLRKRRSLCYTSAQRFGAFLQVLSASCSDCSDIFVSQARSKAEQSCKCAQSVFSFDLLTRAFRGNGDTALASSNAILGLIVEAARAKCKRCTPPRLLGLIAAGDNEIRLRLRAEIRGRGRRIAFVFNATPPRTHRGLGLVFLRKLLEASYAFKVSAQSAARPQDDPVRS